MASFESGSPHALARRRVLMPMLAAALLACTGRAAAAASAQAFAAAAAEFQKAGSGNEAAVADAVEQFARLSQADPGDPVLRAYLGAATAMRARTTMWPWKKIGYAEDGLAQIDKALALLAPVHDAPLYRGVPATLEARFTAASTFLALPSMFNRGERGAKLLDDVATSPLLDGAPPAFRGAVWLRAGQEAAKGGRTAAARRWLGKAAESGAPQAAEAAAHLKAL
jgi:hypothetical protein